MTTYTPTLDRRELASIAADVRALIHTRPVMMPPRRVRQPDGRRIVERRVVEQPCLLDQLRAAAAGALPQRVRGPERHRVPGSQPPPGWDADASDALARIYVELAAWRHTIGPITVPTEQDWHKAVIRHLGERACDLDRPTALELAASVAQWRTRCEAQAR